MKRKKLIDYEIFKSKKIYDPHIVGIWMDKKHKDLVSKIDGVIKIQKASTSEPGKLDNYFVMKIDRRYNPERICQEIDLEIRGLQNG